MLGDDRCRRGVSVCSRVRYLTWVGGSRALEHLAPTARRVKGSDDFYISRNGNLVDVPFLRGEGERDGKPKLQRIEAVFTVPKGFRKQIVSPESAIQHWFSQHLSNPFPLSIYRR